MNVKQSVLAISIAALCSACSTPQRMPTQTSAECVMRSSSTMKVVGHIDDIAEINPLLSPVVRGERKCAISARVAYKGAWHTIFGEYTGPVEIGDQELCINAVELATRQFLASKEAKQYNSEQQMVCSDEPAPHKTRVVQIGDTVLPDEVLPHPTNNAPFEYKGATCKYFIEVDISKTGRGLDQWQGIMCQTGRVSLNNWTVVAKFK